MKRPMKRSLSLLMTLALLLGLVTLPAASATQVTVAAWSAPAAAAESQPATTGTGILTHSLNASINLSSTGYNANLSGAWEWSGGNGQYSHRIRVVNDIL